MAKAWYIIQTYAQYEKRVEVCIKDLINTDDMKDLLFSVYVPSEKIEIMRQKKKRSYTKNIWPGYVLVQLDLSGDDWMQVINRLSQLPGVVMFLGRRPGVRPVEVASEEVKNIFSISEGYGLRKRFVEFSTEEIVKVIDGPFMSFQGHIEEIDYEKERLKISVQIFGRTTSIEVGFSQVERV